MQTLLDIKKALEKAPDKLLEGIWFGLGEGSEEDISMMASEGDGEYEFPQVWDFVSKNYPEILKINDLIQNIGKAQSILDEQDDESEILSEKLSEDGITSDYFDKKKK